MKCAIVTGPTFNEALEQIQKAHSLIELFEFRLDYFTMSFADVKHLRERIKIPCIFTLRKHDQGGKFTQTEKFRYELLEKYLQLQPEYVDIEWDVSEIFYKILENSNVKIIYSYHNFNEYPDKIEEIIATLKKRKAAYYKIAIFTKTILEAFDFLLIAKKDPSLIAICMGDQGKISRFLSPIKYLTIQTSTAPGQLGIDFKKKDNCFGLIGDPVDKSVSDITHNFFFNFFQLNSFYLKFEVKKDQLKTFLNLSKHFPIKGLSVTSPHKELVLSLLDEIDEEALKIGAANTIKYSNGKLKGYNTDGIGCLDAIEKHFNVHQKKIILLGKGGAAKAISYEAKKRGARVQFLGREQFTKDFICDYDLLINCTPLPNPISSDLLIPYSYVMDINTKPKDSDLLKEAKAKDCFLIYGYEMFVQQALGQMQIWFDTSFEDILTPSALSVL